MDYDWKDRAACRGESTADFWAGRNEYWAAKTCEQCTVPNTCLRFAIENKLDWGIWGGHRIALGKRQPLQHFGLTLNGVVEIEFD